MSAPSTTRNKLAAAKAPERPLTSIWASPMIPASAALIAFIRFFRGVDELEQRMHLEGLAFAFGASALATFAYGFLEGAGFPHLNWTFVWPVMALFWIVGGVLARSRYR